jgi:DNA replication protein DnaC
MSALHHLQQQLKTLKLSGMLDAIETRVAQAEDGHLGYFDFLELLLEDEIARRARNSLSARVARAHFDEVKTFETFDFHADPALPSQQIRDLATCRFVETHACVLICGPVGAGKTHVAQALGVEACRRGYTVFFTKTARFLRDLGGGRADGSWEQRFRRYLKPDLLLLDDFAMQDFTPAQGEDLYQLIDERVGRGSLIVTSNRSPQDWYPLFSNAVLAESALDRLAGAAHQLTLTGKSYRPRLRPPLGQTIAPEVERL